MLALTPVTLRGSIVRLEPLGLEHVDALTEVGTSADLWRFTTTNIASHADMQSYVQTAVAWRAAGTALPFVTILQSESRVIGSTRFANFEPEHLKAEIGWTWLGSAWQRTGANVEAKLLMLEHAFEQLRLSRVEFKTDVLNEKSRRALLGIGAQEEGVLRSHMILWNGRVRDTVYYSILREEWPQVRERLRARLTR